MPLALAEVVNFGQLMRSRVSLPGVLANSAKPRYSNTTHLNGWPRYAACSSRVVNFGQLVRSRVSLPGVLANSAKPRCSNTTN